MEDCTERTKVSKVQCKENGRSATFINDGRVEFKKTRIDGCVVKNAISSDFLITIEKVGQVILELKGSDVAHATEQIAATANYLNQKDLRTGKLAGLVVCSQYPRIDTKVQRAKIKFRQTYNAPLHIETKNRDYLFDRVLAFDGPN